MARAQAHRVLRTACDDDGGERTRAAVRDDARWLR